MSALLSGLVRAYQVLLSPVFGGACRFYPSCSEYAVLAIEQHGPWRGTARAIRRISRCVPFGRGGLDLP